MNSLTELCQSQKVYKTKKIKIFIDNDVVFTEKIDFEMHPADALIEALELLGFEASLV